MTALTEMNQWKRSYYDSETICNCNTTKAYIKGLNTNKQNNKGRHSRDYSKFGGGNIGIEGSPICQEIEVIYLVLQVTESPRWRRINVFNACPLWVLVPDSAGYYYLSSNRCFLSSKYCSPFSNYRYLSSEKWSCVRPPYNVRKNELVTWETANFDKCGSWQKQWHG
jgi:hypothetical protein